MPEEADTLTIGAVFAPVPDLTVSVDYFDLEVDDTIGQLVSTVACFDPANTDNRFFEGTENAEPRNAEFLGMTPAPVAIESIGSKSYLDLGLGYRFSQQFGVRLYIANLLDTDPPLMGDAVTSNNTDTRFFDIFGRSYTLSVSARYP